MEFSKKYNREEFLNFLRRDFLPDDFTSADEPVVFATKTTYSKQATKLGVCKSLDLVVYEIKHSGKDDPRIGLSKEAFRMLSEEWQSRALVLFVPETNANNYRFSLIEIKLEGDQTSAKVQRKYSNPRRYSYLLGEGIGGYTPNKYLAKGIVANEKDLLERFSVEVLTKAFYQELQDWYFWAVKIVKLPNDINDDTDDEKYNTESVIRMITRLIFVWFLKQKKLVPDVLFEEDYVREKLLKDFNPNAKTDLFYKSEESKYYKAILQNLFFAMLNSPITPEGKDSVSERKFKDPNSSTGYGDNKLMRYKDKFIDPDLFLQLANDAVPFLNGGLFDCLDKKGEGFYLDGFSDRKNVQKKLIVPDYLFFGEEVGKNVDLSEYYGFKCIVNALGIIDILKRYNFTIEENMPFDQEVSLDPELLGKVFENLLASYNPETKTTARKQTGSFYTPREIVQYMVDESLVAHLKRTVGDGLEEEYRQLMRYTDETPNLNAEQKHAIIKSLYECKILDPACGSGAFPVGALQQMVHILTQLDKDNIEWEKLIRTEADKELSNILDMKLKDEQSKAFEDIRKAFDQNLNNPDYARKLYLIENCIYGVDIQSIAIQISKLRFFISLVVDQKTNNNPIENFGVRPLPNLEAKFVAANTLIGLNKTDATLFDNPLISEKNKELEQANHKLFMVKNHKTKTKYSERIKELRREIADMLEADGLLNNEQARQIANWDMFDQNASSPFFDPEWMFGVRKGFDIVIGNPPYLIVKNSNTKKEILSAYKAYFVADFKINLFALFIENAIALSSNNGIQSFIIPDSSLNLSAFANLRKYILDKGSLLSISLYNDTVFENATVGKSVILTSIKSDKRESFVYRVFNDKHFFSESIVLIENIKRDADVKFIEASSSKELSLVRKIRNRSTIMNAYCAVYDGINPGSEELKNIFFGRESKGFYSKKVLDGKDFAEFTTIKWGGFYVHYSEELSNTIKKQFAESGKSFTARIIKKIDFFNITKIITRQTSDRIVATIDTNNYYTKNSVHSTLIRTEYNKLIDIRFILGILNSKLINWLYQFESNENGRVFPQVKIERLRNLPIVKILHVDQYPLVNLVSRMLETKKDNYLFDTCILENGIDLVVYKLYGLTYDEVLTIDPQTPITQQQYEDENK